MCLFNILLISVFVTRLQRKKKRNRTVKLIVGGLTRLFYSHLFCAFLGGSQVLHSLCSFSMCFLRLSLVLATFPQSEQETWVLAICFASMCLLTSHFLPDIPHSMHWRDPPTPITRYWSIALSSSVSIPRNTFYKTIEQHSWTQDKVCSKYLFQFFTCISHQYFFRFLCSLDMWMPKRTLLSKLSPHWRQVRPPGRAKWAKIWFLAVSHDSIIFWQSLHFQVPPLASNSLSGSSPSIVSSLMTTSTEIHMALY